MEPSAQAQMSRVFTALSDPTRRAVLERLEDGPQTVSTLAEPLTIGLPTVLKHLGVLDDAGLHPAGEEGARRHRDAATRAAARGVGMARPI